MRLAVQAQVLCGPVAAHYYDRTTVDKRTIVIFSGAGLSAESGLATFRSGSGLWHNHKIEDVATPEGFEREAVSMPSNRQIKRHLFRMVSNDGVFICIGTSLNVYPAAGLITDFARVRRKYLIDPEEIRPTGFALLRGPATEKMTALADELLQ